MKKVSVIIVTHDSEAFLTKAVTCLNNQTTKPYEVLIVDTGSKDKSYLEAFLRFKGFQIHNAGEEVGFCKGNNHGLKFVDPLSDYVLLLNPDAYLTPGFIEKAIDFMEKPLNQSVGILTGKLLGFDNTKEEPTGKYDSTGIFRTFWGYWYDRGQGETENKDFETKEYVKAICGALMFIRKTALKEVLIKNEYIFDESFFMYKEDIELSMRMQKKGWKLAYEPEIAAYHCRGWDPNRKKMARKYRLMSARNELIIHKRMGSLLGMCYSSLKYAAVLIFNV
ncbi:glycosyltransferase family 2 protein [Criblamydia sequanensis]|uniref:Glycosyl transferase n=1 Tax=Candidatus Criblamydia sequanensis CRIB-18 TaxID=1437425 RepID=A0A090CZC1_9BACT|nr:glycosyltransferase family 2 protein [Criblamydia sequanensis]CDR34347.1 Glycosyl transferase [Criblamydia sequanensis CRIB-18]